MTATNSGEPAVFGSMHLKSVRNILIIEGMVNVLVTAAKFTIGGLTGSAAILSDALHSLTDVANNVIAFFSMQIAARPPDSNHPYGHKKFEQLAVFILATLLVVVAFEIVVNAMQRFGKPVQQSVPGLIVMVAVLIANIGLTTWERYWARRLDSDILRADSNHTLGDVLTTIAVIIGWQLSAAGFPWLDSLFAIIIAGMVFYLAYDLFKRAVPVLVDETQYDTESLIQAVGRLPDVEQVRRIRSRNIGSASVADVVVTVDGSLSTERSHLIADEIEKLLEEKFQIEDVTVHIEPN